MQEVGDHTLVERPYPSFIKYMGSKSKIMDFVLEGINEVHRGGAVCDLFAGSASLAGAIGQQCKVHSNDIQSYSKVLADAYLLAWHNRDFPTSDAVLSKAEAIYRRNKKTLGLSVDYSDVSDLQSFVELEEVQKKVIDRHFRREWHLFAKYYSGTWWSVDQCLWIDALREVAELYADRPAYPVVLASLMFAMAYTSQGTGHYAQYRDAKTKSSLKDILIYRRRSLPDYFRRKYEEVVDWLPVRQPAFDHVSTTLDYGDCLGLFEGGTVYADPPYCFVHYSRFYHALETLIKYDYPPLQVKGGKVVKGRYRESRHQSPFSIKTQVKGAFKRLFEGVQSTNSSLALSYSNTGMISFEDVVSIAEGVFPRRKMELLFTDHQHMTLGRQKDRHREVKECLLLVF